MKVAVSIFKFFASLKLAIFLLFALALVFAVGTFVESAYEIEAAKLLVYRSPWMSLLLVLLALNVAGAALDRLPWKRKHVGFVVTHAGIIVILTGALVTRAYGIEGQMAIQEGKSASRLILDEPLLQLFSPDLNSLTLIPIPRQAFPWQGRKPLHADPGLQLLRYYPKASRREKIEASPNGPAALEVILESSWMKGSHWLFLDDPERHKVLLGPAELRFTREPRPREVQTEAAGFLEFQFEKNTIQVPLGEKFSKKIRLEGTSYEVTILRVLKDAWVEGGQLVNRSEAWNNPACEFLLEGEGLREKHTVFSQFPDFPTLHGMKPSQTGIQIRYRRPEAESAFPKNELRFIWREEGLPAYQIFKGKETTEGMLQPGAEYETGWMDFKFRLSHYYPHARVSRLFSEEPVQSEAEEHLSAVQLELEQGGERKSFWLGQGDQEQVAVGNQIYQVLYGLRTLPLGFRLELQDFRVEHDPGTTRPASFESEVTLKDDSAGIVREVTLRMNQPLQYRGFKVFQSGYQQPEGGPEISIFTVAKDPGIPVKYAGAVVLIGGILTMFYSKRFSRRAGEEIPVNPVVGAGSLRASRPVGPGAPRP